jgi:mercuric ion binding protein
MPKLLIAALVALSSSCFAAPSVIVILDVPNMNCGLCPVTIKKALEKVQGVESVIVDSDRKTAKVTYDPDKASPESLTKATADSGYPSVVQK